MERLRKRQSGSTSPHWERQASLCNQYLAKGQRELVVGDDSTENWATYTDTDGNTRATLDVRATS